MKAVIYEKYGSPDELKFTDIATPVPGDEDLRVKIQAVSINGADKENLVGRPLYTRLSGLRKPAKPILGSDIAGYVEAVGKNHSRFKVGDAVFGEIPDYHGGFAEYACLRGDTLILKPDSLSFEQAAAIPQAGVIAIQGIRDKGQVQAGQAILINGGGGSAGSFAIQIARHLGAEITGVDNALKLDFMRSLGADQVIDYQQEDFTKTGKQYDLILDLIAHRSVFDYQRALKPGGQYFFVGGSVGLMFQILFLGPIIKGRSGGKRINILGVPQNSKDLLAITELCTAGQVTPIIDRQYPLRELPEAMRYVSTGQAKGKVVITVS